MQEWTEKQQALRDEIMHQRHYTIDQTGKTDTYIRAWTMIKNSAEQGVTWFGMKHRKKVLIRYMEDLNLYAYVEADEESKAVYYEQWEDFACKIMDLCFRDKTYGSAMFGLLPISKEALVNKVIHDIALATIEYPEKFGLESYFSVLNGILTKQLEIHKEVILKEEV
ncbi:MAG: hypothetical protein II067_04785 [Agathobacter sp.]|uniref:DUF6553 family protein n=1 Tax=Agathobacter sp. TaxID=2021311 RepID=UPI00257D44AF|nr:DUF6553 family protein [Agathobacter sp.]MBQ1681517.1 hypothetical protein [Agathobacter sp.]